MTSGDTKASGVRPTRRTVVKGAAWAVPAVVVANATPALAASPGVVSLTGLNCKLPGSSSPWSDGAVFLATINNDTAATVTVSITSFQRGDAIQTGSDIAVVKLSATPAGNCCVNLSNVFTVGPGSGTYAIITKNWGDSGTAPLLVNYSVNDIEQNPATGSGSGLNPLTSNPQCGIGGSCSYTEAQSQCILTAIGVAGCTGGCS